MRCNNNCEIPRGRSKSELKTTKTPKKQSHQNDSSILTELLLFAGTRELTRRQYRGYTQVIIYRIAGRERRQGLEYLHSMGESKTIDEDGFTIPMSHGYWLRVVFWPFVYNVDAPFGWATR